jgi:hypothetical protein
MVQMSKRRNVNRVYVPIRLRSIFSRKGFWKVKYSFSAKRIKEVGLDLKLLPIYFVLGGTIVTVATYVGKRGQGILAALVASVPTISVITFCTIYFSAGTEKAAGFAKGMLIILPAWIVYAIALWQLLPRLGLIPTVIIGITAFVGLSLLISRFFQN